MPPPGGAPGVPPAAPGAPAAGAPAAAGASAGGEAEPTGPGWVIQMIGYHFHNKNRSEQGAQYVRETIMKKLETGSVLLPVGPGGKLESVLYKDLGMANPVLIETTPIREREIPSPDADEPEPVDNEFGKKPSIPMTKVQQFDFVLQFSWQPTPMSKRMQLRMEREKAKAAETPVAAVPGAPAAPGAPAMPGALVRRRRLCPAQAPWSSLIMDKVKIYLGLLLKYHFWVLLGIVLITGLTGWIMATNSLAAIYAAQKVKIESHFSRMRAITGVNHHPNKTFEAGVDSLLDQKGTGLKSRVLAAWNSVYEEQRNKVLIWPSELGEDFLAAVAEKTADDEIDVQFRERYQNYVKAEFPRLVEMVSAAPYTLEAEKKRTAAVRGLAAASDLHDSTEFKVYWKPASQQDIDNSLDWPRPPTTKEMFYVQEDLWVYHALLRVLARVNEESTAMYNAKIKEIRVIAIAREAAQEFKYGTAAGKIYLPPGTTTTVAQARIDAAKQQGNAALQAVQEEGRYVDATGQPLEKGAACAPEFKRMPVYLQLLMDQREVPKLLAECANSPLLIEVKQLRINPVAMRGKVSKTTSPSVFGGVNRQPGGAQVARRRACGRRRRTRPQSLRHSHRAAWHHLHLQSPQPRQAGRDRTARRRRPAPR